MGTILYPGAVTFRALRLSPRVSWPLEPLTSWSVTANPFASEGNGYWSVDVPGGKAGDEFQFVIHNGDQTLWNKNPYASEVVHSSGNSIIQAPDFYWTGETFTMPSWNELVIYEMHLGSFKDSNDAGPGTFDDTVRRCVSSATGAVTARTLAISQATIPGLTAAQWTRCRFRRT